MTDMEMDMKILQAENAELKKTIEILMGQKCNFGPGVTIMPNGKDELDPCIYEVIGIHANVTVVVKRCLKCGHVELEWHTQENTEDILDGDGDV